MAVRQSSNFSELFYNLAPLPKDRSLYLRQRLNTKKAGQNSPAFFTIRIKSIELRQKIKNYHRSSQFITPESHS